MNGTNRWMLRGVAIFLGLLLGGCAVPAKRAQVLDPDFAALSGPRLALLPVALRDHALDRYFEAEASAEIRSQAQRVLAKKGYDVLLADGPAETGLWSRFTLEKLDPSELVKYAPEGTDAVVVIWIDNLLDRGIYDDGKHFTPLQLYATASVVSVSAQKEIWRDSGSGSSGSSPTPPASFRLLLFTTADELAHSLFATLPPATRP